MLPLARNVSEAEVLRFMLERSQLEQVGECYLWPRNVSEAKVASAPRCARSRDFAK